MSEHPGIASGEYGQMALLQARDETMSETGTVEDTARRIESLDPEQIGRLIEALTDPVAQSAGPLAG